MLGHFSCGDPSESSKQAGQHNNVETSLQQSQSKKQLSYHGHMQNSALTKGGKKEKKKGRHAFFPKELHYWELQLLLYEWCKHFCFPSPTNTGGKAQSSPVYPSLNNPQVHSVAYTFHLCVEKNPQQPSQAVQVSVPRASGLVQLRPQNTPVYNNSSLGFFSPPVLLPQ